MASKCSARSGVIRVWCNPASVESWSDLDALLDEQRMYYREIAPDYEKHALEHVSGALLLKAFYDFGAEGEVLELACGTGVWTERLTRTARRVTAVDASEEMIEIAATRVEGHSVDFIQADLFSWRPPRRFDAVVFCFWLSHVPMSRFESFWETVADALVPGGRVFFADDAHRTPQELVYGEDSEVVQRHLQGHGPRRVVKVAHTVQELESRLDALGWKIRVTQTEGPFYWGVGSRRHR